MNQTDEAANFRIRKYYMDCIDAAGNGSIMYHAQLRWGRLAFNYVGDLRFTRDASLGTRGKLVRTPPPHFELQTPRTLTWDCPALDTSGAWTSKRKVVSKCLLHTAEGEVNWNCLQPAAHAEVKSGGAMRLSGAGYTEYLDLTIKPWRLPIEQLRWGRFLSEIESIVWIEWRGPHPLNLVIRNGRQVHGALIGDRTILAEQDEWELHFADSLTLRDGTLLATVFDKIPLVKQSIPVKMLNAHESKWRSRGTFRCKSASPVTGWAIHERVQWRSQ